MSVFAGYSRYYDLLYRDKDYAAEARYVHELLRKHAPGVRSLVEIGCGTGAHAVELESLGYEVVGIDMSPAYVAYARERLDSARARFEIGDARELPVSSDSFDVAVSGLALNFVPAPDRALGEMTRAVRPGGVVAAYVWDYAGRMEMMRRFWDAAVALDPSAARLDEGVRFPLCNPDALVSLWRDGSLDDVEVRAIDATTRFADFDDFWSPFLGGQGPAPGYLMSRSEGDRAALREVHEAALHAEEPARRHLELEPDPRSLRLVLDHLAPA